MSAQLIEALPIDMVLHCPACGMQHIDAPGPVREDLSKLDTWKQVLYVQDWTNPPHRSHLCHSCGHIWRPADVPTNGVAAVKTKGKDDSPIASRATLAAAEAQPVSVPQGWRFETVSDGDVRVYQTTGPIQETWLIRNITQDGTFEAFCYRMVAALAAAPAAPAVQPLTDEQIHNLSSEWVYIRAGRENEQYDELRLFARAIESAHGITGPAA